MVDEGVVLARDGVDVHTFSTRRRHVGQMEAGALRAG